MSLKNTPSIVALMTFILILPHCKKNEGFVPMPCGLENGACNDSNPCTKDKCDELTNECVFVPLESFECLPRIIIDEPIRAVDIQEDGNVEVKGRVSSGYGPVQDFKINDTPVDIENDDTFTFSVSPDFGMNLLIAEAKDQTGATTKAVQSFFYSTHWVPRDPHDPDLSTIPEAIYAWLGRHAIDDGDHDLDHVDDLATVCEIIVSSTDLQGLSNPDEPVNSFALPGLGSFDVYVTAVRLGPPSVTLSPQNGGLHLRLSYAWMEADLEFRQPGPTVGSETVYPAMATANPVIIDADMGISTIDGGGIQVEASNANVTMENFNIAFDLENDTLEAAINAVLNIDLIKQVFIQQIEQSFEDQLSGTLEELVAGFLGSTAFETDNEFPPILGSEEPTTIKLKATPKSAEFSTLGGTIGLEASALSDRSVYYPTLGSISRSGCLLNGLTTLWFDPTYTIQFAIQDDFANQALFAVWWGGGFQFHQESSEEAIAQLSRIGITDLVINVDVLHPPILSSCNSENIVRMQIGDMKIRITLEIAGSEYVNLDVYTSLEADMEYRVLEIDNTPVISLNFAEVRRLETEVVLDDPSLAKHLETLRDFIENFFINNLIENLTTGDVAGFPLPVIDLSVVEGVPPGYELKIGIDSVLHVGDYTLVQGHPE